MLRREPFLDCLESMTRELIRSLEEMLDRRYFVLIVLFISAYRKSILEF